MDKISHYVQSIKSQGYDFLFSKEYNNLPLKDKFFVLISIAFINSTKVYTEPRGYYRFALEDNPDELFIHDSYDILTIDNTKINAWVCYAEIYDGVVDTTTFLDGYEQKYTIKFYVYMDTFELYERNTKTSNNKLVKDTAKIKELLTKIKELFFPLLIHQTRY